MNVQRLENNRLPDWFLGFDVYDRTEARFWASERRDALLADLGIAVVPRLAAGRFAFADLEALLKGSQVGRAPMEGLVVRREAAGWTTERAKLVRERFVQGIGEHWSRGPLRQNALEEGVPRWR